MGDSTGERTERAPTGPMEITRRLVSAINRQIWRLMRGLIPLQQRFTDSVGNVVPGTDSVLSAWKAYFELVPDYEISAEIWMAEGDRGPRSHGRAFAVSWTGFPGTPRA